MRGRCWRRASRPRCGCCWPRLVGAPAFAATTRRPCRPYRRGGGRVLVYDTESREWVAPARNRPFTSGAGLAVDGAGSAELQVGSTSVRLDGGSELEILRWTTSGSFSLRAAASPCECARPNWLAMWGWPPPRGASRRAGPRFRVDRRDDSSVGTAWRGQLQFGSDDRELMLTAGRSAELGPKAEEGRPSRLGRAAATVCRLAVLATRGRARRGRRASSRRR